MRTDALLFAPGGGLGHLNRALALGLALRSRGLRAGIVTDSPFARGIAEWARFPVTRIAPAEWSQCAPALVQERRPGCIVIDTFPQGLHGEWNGNLAVPAIHLARRMKEGMASSSPARAVIVTEPLDASHEDTISRTDVEMTRLTGRIRLSPGTIGAPVPEALERILATGRAALVIHSGVESEVRHLIGLARGSDPVAVITPWPIGFGVPSFDYFPAGNLIERAAKVFSGAGYNILADMSACREKHTAVAFERRYDDQAARLRTLPWGIGHDGTADAADAVLRAIR